MKIDDVLVIVEGKPIRVEDVLVHLKASGIFRNAACQLVEFEVIEKYAREQGIAFTEEELHNYLEGKRRYLGLPTASHLQTYFRNNGITYEQWRRAAERELIREKVRKAIANEKVIQSYYEAHRDAHRTVSLSRIVAERREILEEVKKKAEAGESFFQLARTYSIEESTRISGGFLGTILWSRLPAKMAEVLSKAKVNDILGPFQENHRWTIYRLDAMNEPELTPSLRREIEERLFAEWLHQAVRCARYGA